MTYLPHGYTVEDALARSEDVYEVDFRFWGFYDPSVPFTMPQVGMQFPPPGQRGLPSSLAAISIGPRSQVDRVWISWDRQKPLNQPTAESEAADFISPSRIVTVDAPLLFTQRGHDGVIAPAAQSINEALQKGLLYAFPFANFDSLTGTTAPNSPADGTTVAPGLWLNQFGTVQTETPFVGINGNGAIPFLHLILHLRPPAFAPPTKRAPFLKTATWLNPTGVLSIATIAPIFGRKHLSVQMVSSLFGGGGLPTSPTDFYIGLIRGTNRGTRVFEVRAGSSLATPVGTPASFSVENPNADWVVLWTDPTGASGQGAYTIVATD